MWFSVRSSVASLLLKEGHASSVMEVLCCLLRSGIIQAVSLDVVVNTAVHEPGLVIIRFRSHKAAREALSLFHPTQPDATPQTRKHMHMHSGVGNTQDALGSRPSYQLATIWTWPPCIMQIRSLASLHGCYGIWTGGADGRWFRPDIEPRFRLNQFMYLWTFAGRRQIKSVQR